MAEIAGYGTWTSPIDARAAAGDSGMPRWVSAHDDAVWWCDPRPAEGGRVALVRRRAGGTVETVLPAPWNARTRVHEYGGLPYVVLPDGSAVFAELTDQRLHVIRDGGEPRPLTPDPERPAGLRYAEPFLAPAGDEVWCIREEHHSDNPIDVSRAIVAVPLDGSAATDSTRVRVIVEDGHFLACPQVSPGGTQLSWIAWDHPAMPWDSTTLRVARLHDDGSTLSAGEPWIVAGGPGVSVPQACWLDESTLLTATDADGWWNLHRIDLSTGRTESVCPREEEFAGPLWLLGSRWFAPLPDGRVATLHGAGPLRLGLLDPCTGELAAVETPYTEWSGSLHVAGHRVLCAAGAADRPFEVVEVDATTGVWETVPEASGRATYDAHLPVPEIRTFTAADGREVHAHVFPPRNPLYAAPAGERPPYLVFVHGGPTSRVPLVEDLEIAYFTSRGLAVVDVNYGGSTGYGREYRNRLREQWGVVDVADCVAVAEALVAEGLADPARLAIRGGSAGGWTTAAAMTTTDVFACGTISFPILDLADWQADGTHDFESQYLHSLVGPWPEESERYAERSPLTHADRLRAPFLMLQGLDDPVCTPVHAERFLERIAGRGIPHAYLTFEGESHGFRKEETIVAALEAELSLYGQVFGFEPPGIPRLDLHP